jgi:WD40 repeat protein
MPFPAAWADAPKETARTDHFGDPLPDGALARIGTTRLRHGNWAIMVAFSPDGKLLASSGNDNLVRIWDPQTGREVRRLEGHTHFVNTVTFAPDGKTLASGSADGTIRLWETATGKELGLIGQRPANGARIMGSMVRVVVFSPDGKTLVSEGTDGVLHVWDVATAKEIRRLPGDKSNGTSNVAFLPDGKSLVSVADNGTLRLTEIATGKIVRQFVGHQGEVESLAVSRDGKRLVSGGHDSTVRLWDVDSGKELRQLLGHEKEVATVRFSPDGKTVASAGYDRAIRLWDVEGAAPPRLMRGHQNTVSEVEFSPDGKTLASAAWDCTVRLWDVATARPVPQLEHYPAAITCAALSADGRWLATAGGDTISLWEPATGKLLPQTLSDPTPGAKTPVTVTGLVLAPAGGLLASIGDDFKVRLWDLASGKVRHRIELKGSRTGFLQLSTDGRTLALVGPNGSVRLWDTTTGKEQEQPLKEGPNRDFDPLTVLAPDARALAWSWGEPIIHLVDLPAGSDEGRRLEGSSLVSSLAFSADGKTLAAGSPAKALQLWEVATGRERASFTGLPGAPALLGFSADGRLLAWGEALSGPLHIWDPTTRLSLAELAGHQGRVTQLLFSRDNKLLVTGSTDGTMLVWDQAPLRKDLKLRPGKLSPGELDTLWSDLSSEDAAKAFRAVWALASAPDQAVPLLRERLPRAGPTMSADTVARLLADLDSDEFPVREKATVELEKLGRSVEAAARKAMEKPASLEVRLRLERVLEKIHSGVGSPDVLRASRAMEVLEQAGTPEARKLLETLAQGAPEALLTREAQAVLLRLAPIQTPHEGTP